MTSYQVSLSRENWGVYMLLLLPATTMGSLVSQNHGLKTLTATLSPSKYAQEGSCLAAANGHLWL